MDWVGEARLGGVDGGGVGGNWEVNIRNNSIQKPISI